jgi:hypothetical protein
VEIVIVVKLFAGLPVKEMMICSHCLSGISFMHLHNSSPELYKWQKVESEKKGITDDRAMSVL